MLERFDPNLKDEAAASQQESACKEVAAVAAAFPARNVDGMATTECGGLVPLRPDLLQAASKGEAEKGGNEGGEEGSKMQLNLPSTPTEVQKLRSDWAAFLREHVRLSVLRAAVSELESMPIDDITKVKPFLVLEKQLHASLDAVVDEDCLRCLLSRVTCWALNLSPNPEPLHPG